MRTFNNICAQGDVLIRRVSEIPGNVKEDKAENGHLIVTHSETGHNHVMVIDRPDDPDVQMYTDTDNPLKSWIKVNRPTALEHQREHDTHEPILFDQGVYEVRRQREYTPEGFRRAQD